MSWHAYEDGRTLGQIGSEMGEIILDDECDAGARITLEADHRGLFGQAKRTAPFTITCGVYGLLVHTRFFGAEGEARDAYFAMRERLAAIAQLDASEYRAAGSKFIEDFP